MKSVRLWLGSLGLLSTVLLFQNCGSGFNSSEDVSSAVLSSSRTNLGSAPFLYPESLWVDNTHAYVLDAELDALIEINLATLESYILSGTEIGQGADFDHPFDLTINARKTLAYVSDKLTRSIFQVDLANGNRSIIASATVGSGPLSHPDHLVLSRDERTIYFTDEGIRSVIRLNISTGQRTLVTGEGVGSGPNIFLPKDIRLNSAGTLAFVNAAYGIYSINLATGLRTMISSFGASSSSISFTEDERYLLFSEPGAIYKIDLSTGERTLVTDNGRQSPFISLPRHIDISKTSNDLFVIDNFYRTLLKVDLATGQRTVIAKGPFNL